MRSTLIVLSLLLGAFVASGQSKVFVKVGMGPSIPLGIFEDAETQEEAANVRTGTNFGLTVGRDLHKNFGISLTASNWKNAVDEAKLAAQAIQQYPFVQELRVAPQKWRFQTVYVSPHGTVRINDWLRLDGRFNAGVLWSRYPAFTGTGTGLDPRDGQPKPFTVVTQSLSGTSFAYGGGVTAAVRVEEQFHLYVDIDGIRSKPQFPASTIQAGLGNNPGDPNRPPNLSINQDRAEFRQKVGTLSVRFGIGLFF